MVEGALDALAIAASAATSGLSAKYAPLSASGLRLSDQQIDTILALHPKPPVLAADGDQAGRDANLEWAARIALRRRESVVTTWPEGQDPASWLATHGPDGLRAVTRRGCLDAPPDDLRPRHCGAVLTQAALDQLPDAGDRSAALQQLAAEVTNISGYLGPKAGERYATAAADVLAPVALSVGIDAAIDGSEIIALIEHVAVYGSKLPRAGQEAFTRRAAEAFETNDLGAAGWIERRLRASVNRRGGGNDAPVSDPLPLGLTTSNGATVWNPGDR